MTVEEYKAKLIKKLERELKHANTCGRYRGYFEALEMVIEMVKHKRKNKTEKTK